MDDRLPKALEHANYAATVARQKKNLRVQFETALLYSINGGTFVANPALISFVDLLLRDGSEDAVLLDEKDNPILIEDLLKFKENLLGLYHGAINEYYAGYVKLRKARTVKAVVGL